MASLSSDPSVATRPDIMRPLLALAFVAFTILIVEGNQNADLLERAEAELEKDLFRRTLNGATSPRFNRKKFTAT